jgi:2-oxoglutarate/2-oxoacid ferredoxin oxidoreductase subunit alpha
VKLLLGNEAIAHGALAGGVTFFAGYPLAQSSEIDAALLASLGKREGATVLVEDSAAALGAVLGAGAGGGLGATALTGDALGAAEELLRFGMAQQIPALIAVVGARPDPSQGVERAGQSEVRRLHLSIPGGGPAPVWAPASSQECFTLARAAAVEARERATPVLLYVDDVIAHLREPVADPDDKGDRGGQAAPPAELYRTRDATILVVAFGIVARAARSAVRLAREQGVRAGLFRPVRLWPFPFAELEEAAARARALLVTELNEGQLLEPIAAHMGAAHAGPAGRTRPRGVREPRTTRALSEPSSGILRPGTILESLMEAA